MHIPVAEFVARRWSVPPQLLRVHVRHLAGGLESNVALARVAAGRDHASVPRRLIVKELRGSLRREAAVYERLWQHLDAPPAARALGTHSTDQAHYLYLEEVKRSCAWPWSDSRVSADVCRALARLHESELRSPAGEWDYEGELVQSARETLWLATHARDMAGARCWRRPGDLKRVVASLSSMRTRLFESGVSFIHGDVHPGNVVVRAGAQTNRIVLIDWGRARLGSPLEDVASWLHSLGCWEPEARRRHDTLLRAYLATRSAPRALAAGLRRDYWFASASNGLAGAIRYHLAVLSNPAATKRTRRESRHALSAWERVIRRTAALLNAELRTSHAG